MTDGVSRRTALATLASGTVPPIAGTRADSIPTIRTGSALEKLREIGASVRDTGAVGDGRADDTAAIQEMADYFARVGGEWHLPPGVYRTTAPLLLNGTKPQRVCGQGKRGVYPGPFDLTQQSQLAVILPIHSGRAAIQFSGSRNGDGSVELRDLALATLESGPVPVAGLAWDAAGSFLRDFAFIGCSIHGFTSALDLFTSGKGREMGLLKVRRCTINRNRWIARTLNGTQWNGFSFCDNEAGQNGYNPDTGGIAVAAHNAVVAGNCLEGQRDALTLSGGSKGVSVRDNYFEANVGTATIHLQNVPGPFDIGPNSILAADRTQLDHLVLLTRCGHGRVLGSYWADGVHRMALPTGSGRQDQSPAKLTSATSGLLRLDSFDSGNTYTREPLCSAMAKQRVVAAGRELAPWNGHPMPVAHHDTARGAAIPLTYTLTAPPGRWIGLSWLFRRLSNLPAETDPYLSLSVNGTGAPGSRDYVAYGFDRHWQTGEWCLITAAVRLGTTMSRMSVGLYPYGTKASPGLQTSFLHPVLYVTDRPEKIIPYVDDYTARSVMAPPAVPGFHPGDLLINGAASTAGQSHYLKLAGGWVYG